MNSIHQPLFEPFQFKNGIKLRNRVVMAPMTTWASNDDYTVSDEEVAHYEARGNGVGLVITGCTRVTPSGIGFTNEFAAYDDKFLPSLRKLAAAAKSGGAPAILQIYHAGNRALASLIPGEDLVSATSQTVADPNYTTNSKPPRMLSEDEINEMIQAFGNATSRAIEAGFDGVEVHGAHGFLLQNFVSPLFNQRTDQWGGSLENRLRFPLAVVAEIQRVIKEHSERPFLFGYRFSPEEPLEGGLRIDEACVLVERLVEAGIDYLHVSLGKLVSDKPSASANDDTTLSTILNLVHGRTPVLSAGGVLTADDAAAALQTGLSLVAVARGLVINPNWLELIRDGKSDEIETALSISRIPEKAIPAKLWAFVQTATGWFQLTD
jgi:2,4-dienoyl-CoA reductase-like NADH-dependent reductase (Old Yellow Enzyme family)